MFKLYCTRNIFTVKYVISALSCDIMFSTCPRVSYYFSLNLRYYGGRKNDGIRLGTTDSDNTCAPSFTRIADKSLLLLSCGKYVTWRVPGLPVAYITYIYNSVIEGEEIKNPNRPKRLTRIRV